MKYKKLCVFFLLGILINSAVYADVECDVEFRAKRITYTERWFGKVEKPEFSAGVATAEGKDRRQCVRQALAEQRRRGWRITWHRVLSVRHD